MVSDKVFNTDGTQKIFSSDFAIISEDHIRVHLGAAVVSRDNYDLINNAAVFNEAPAASQVLRLQVGTTPADILVSPTDAGIVAANISNINTVAGLSSDVGIVASNIAGFTADVEALKDEFVLLKSGMDPDELLSVGADGSFEWKSELDNIVIDASMNGGYF
jgi:hypothetical protein